MAGRHLHDGPALQHRAHARAPDRGHPDEHAFAELVARHSGLVLGVGRRITRDHHDAEDAAQALFLVLARKAVGLRGHTNLGGWLFTTARLTALRLRATKRARTRREAALSRTLLDQPAAPPAASGATAPGSMPDEHACALDAALAVLPEISRQPLVPHYLEGRSGAAIAELLGIRADNVALRLSRGRQRLQPQQSRTLPSGVVLGVLAGAYSPNVTVADGLAGSAHRLVHAGGTLASAPQPAAAAALARAVIRTAHRTLLHATALILAGVVLAAGVVVAATRLPARQGPPSAPTRAASDGTPHASAAAATVVAAMAGAAAGDPDAALVPDPLLGGLVERLRPAWMAVLAAPGGDGRHRRDRPAGRCHPGALGRAHRSHRPAASARRRRAPSGLHGRPLLDPSAWTGGGGHVALPGDPELLRFGPA